MPPLRSTIDEKELARLIAVYQRAEREILATIADATEFGTARRAEQLLQIDTILTRLGAFTGEWLGSTIEQQYERGTTDLIKDLQSLRVGIKESTTMSQIDQRAVAALVSETQEAFAAGLTAVSRNAARVISKAVREAIQDDLAQGRILGETRKEVSARIKATIQQEGISALTDRGGRQWSLDRYAEMLARTKMVEARNTGLLNKAVANGYDLVQVSSSFSKHEECRRWEGRILSITSKTPGYPTVTDAIDNGLLHPNCKHQLNAVKLDYAAITTAYDPRSRSYVQPFKNNAPKAPSGQIRVPDAPKKATPSMSIIRDKSITMASAGHEATYDLTALEGKFVNLSGLKVTTSDGKMLALSGTRGSKNVRGYYTPHNHAMVMRTVHDHTDKQTFYHELGHALDFSAFKVLDEFTGKLRFAGTMGAAIRKDTTAVVARRIQANYAENYDLSFEEALKIASPSIRYGKFTEKKTGKVIEGGIKPSWRTYARKQEEVFADAYGRYRLEPAKFKKYAPNMYAEFKRLGL